MTDLEDTEIADGIVEELRESEERVRKAAIEHETYWVSYHLYDGYDGVDIHVDASMGFEVIGWNESPPSYGLFDEALRRYDFRDFTFSNLREKHRHV